MLTIAISLFFGLVAFAALAQIHVSVSQGARCGRVILAELARGERETRFLVRSKSALRLDRPAWQPELAAA